MLGIISGDNYLCTNTVNPTMIDDIINEFPNRWSGYVFGRVNKITEQEALEYINSIPMIH